MRGVEEKELVNERRSRAVLEFEEKVEYSCAVRKA